MTAHYCDVIIIDRDVIDVVIGCLRDVVVLVRIVLVALHVVAVDEGLDSLLKIRRLDWKLELVVEFGDEQVVRQRFSHLHDPDDGRVDLILTILEDPLLRRLLLLCRLLQLHLVDLDVEQLQEDRSMTTFAME